jgi:hypothetical protein
MPVPRHYKLVFNLLERPRKLGLQERVRRPAAQFVRPEAVKRAESRGGEKDHPIQRPDDGRRHFENFQQWIAGSEGISEASFEQGGALAKVLGVGH